jgi:hypothetical protein
MAAIFGISCSHSASPPCPSDALRGIYSPSRLKVLGECVTFEGTVSVVEQRPDGDFHVGVTPSSGSEKYLNDGNGKDQNGDMVVEIVPGQHLPLPKVGERVSIFGTWVLDTHNNWNEIHPVWSIDYLDRNFRSDVLPPPSPLYQGKSDD